MRKGRQKRGLKLLLERETSLRLLISLNSLEARSMERQYRLTIPKTRSSASLTSYNSRLNNSHFNLNPTTDPQLLDIREPNKRPSSSSYLRLDREWLLWYATISERRSLSLKTMQLHSVRGRRRQWKLRRTRRCYSNQS